jgi:hypothetical protein
MVLDASETQSQLDRALAAYVPKFNILWNTDYHD